MIVVVGEALIDALVSRDGIDVTTLPGGAPMNVAVAVARLGTDARFLGRTSTDAFGRRLRAHLATEGVSVDGAPVGDEPTAVALVTTDDDGHPTYRFLWDATADRSLRLDELPDDLAGAVALVVGGVSTVLEPGATAIEALVEREQSRVAVVLDPNVRAQFVSQMDAHRDRVERLVRASTVVKVSDEDLDVLGHPDHLATIRRWATADDGPALVILTRGPDGPVAVTSDGATVSADAPQVEVFDTVGAGDSFLAATVAWLAQRDRLTRPALRALDAVALSDLLAYAARAAAITCTRPGADPPTAADLVP